MSAPNPKPALADQLAIFSVKFQEILAAKAALATLEGEASTIGDDIMKAHGKGPHNILIPDMADTTKRRAFVVVFQRVAKTVRFESTDVTDLVASLSAQNQPQALPQDPAARIAAATGG